MFLLNLIFLFTLFIPLGIILTGLHRKTMPGEIIKKSIVVNLIAAMVVLVVDKIQGGFIEKDFKANVDKMMETLAEGGISQVSGVSLEELGTLFNSSIETMLVVMPATIIIWTIVISFVEYKICYAVGKKKRGYGKLQEIVPIQDFTLKREFFTAILIIFIVSLIASLVLGEVGTTIYINVSLLIRFLFALQGIAVVITFLTAKRTPVALAVTISIIIYLLPFGSMLLTLLGIAEAIVGLRRRIQIK